MVPKKEVDPYYRVKFMGYCLSQLPPEGVTSTLGDFINYAKFQLSVDKHVLMEDPIWDRYTDEMILVEYFANLFSKSKERLRDFEVTLQGAQTTIDDFNTWADVQIAKNQKELEEKAKDLDDSVHFSPESFGG